MIMMKRNKQQKINDAAGAELARRAADFGGDTVAAASAWHYAKVVIGDEGYQSEHPVNPLGAAIQRIAREHLRAPAAG